MIDETKSQIPIWLLWARSENGLVTLVAVTLTQLRAKQYQTVLRTRPDFVEVRIEKSEANHLFQPELDVLWERLYGEKFLEKVRKESSKELIHERNKYRRAFIELRRVVYKALRKNDERILKKGIKDLTILFPDLMLKE
jgi:hypothetical protein